ncbi:MAG: hypothetical protein QG602_1444 [Verrucomicrobiota bacterium]|nr:hypothetical protein [Verrucomicrobiota bacterium]
MTAPEAITRRSFWQRRVRDPIIALFTQGITPDKVALTLAVGTACSLFPFLGFTALLNLGVGLRLRMNQPILQTLNQLLGPLQLLLIVAYVRLGEWVWRAQDARFTIAEMLRVFREASPGEFIGRFGWAGVHAFTAWALTAPLLIATLYWVLRPALRRLASKSAARA